MCCSIVLYNIYHLCLISDIHGIFPDSHPFQGHSFCEMVQKLDMVSGPLSGFSKGGFGGTQSAGDFWDDL